MIWGVILAASGIGVVLLSQTKDFRLKFPLIFALIVAMIVATVNLPATNTPGDEACGSGYLNHDC